MPQAFDVRRYPLALLANLLLATFTMTPAAAEAPEARPTLDHGLTAIPGIQVGHAELEERPSGCTVILVERGAVAGVDIRGGAPGSREAALLDPVNTVREVHALVLSGGSAFGLDTATGVMRFLEERDIGFKTGTATVPIVPAAILYDLAFQGAKPRPDATTGYRAAKAAHAGPVRRGNVGAGAGATVGKLLGMDRAMKGGLGSVALRLENGLTVAALVAVNAVGDVVDPATGQIVAGARTVDGEGFADLRQRIRAGETFRPMPAQNTTIGVVATNATLTKAQATKVAQMAQDGLARTIYPSHTPWDGDTVYALATGDLDIGSDILTVGSLAADAMAEAVLDAIRSAKSLKGMPAASDLGAESKD